MSEAPHDPGHGVPPGGAGRPDGADHGDGPGISAWLRGVGVVVVAVVIGAVLMPSGTRAPLHAVTAAETSPPGSSSGTSYGHGAGTTTTTTTTLPTVVPGAATVHVLVANGTSVTGLAAGVSTYLHTRGYSTLPPANATTKVSATHVYATAAEQGVAGTVVSVLGLPASDIEPADAVAPVARTTGATVVVVAGPDLARLAPGAGASGGSTPAA